MMRSSILLLAGGFCAMAIAVPARGAVTTFFDGSQSVIYSQGATSETLTTEGYQITHTLDKYWAPVSGGTPTGRFQSMFWPDGLHAQAVTVGAGGGVPANPGAQIDVKRVDNAVFDITSFTIKLLANTAGAGASIEIMPKLNGEDAFANPLALDATGYGGMAFHYNTPTLVDYESYDFKLYVDFALTDMTVVDASVVTPEPSGLVLLVAGLGVLARRRARMS